MQIRGVNVTWHWVWVKLLRVPVWTAFWVGLSLAFLSLTPQIERDPGVDKLPPLQVKLDSNRRNAERSWWVRPAAVELASTAKTSSEERERLLTERIVQETELPPEEYEPPYVDQSMGVTVVRTKHQVLATLMPEDLPEYAGRLKEDARAALEAQYAQKWAHTIGVELAHKRWRQSPSYRSNIGYVLLILVAVCLCWHQILSVWGRYVFDSPLWGPKTLLWAMAVTLVLFLLPGAEGLGYLVGEGITGPLFSILLLGLIGSAATHLCHFFLGSYMLSLRATQRYGDQQPRAELRLITIQHALEFGISLLIWLVVLFLGLISVHISVSNLATGAGLLGASLTFVCQDVIRDFLAGLNILLEDQFGVGDWIEGAGVSGQVEAFTLRSTQIRCADGSLFCAPNSELRRVKNQSKDWSRVDFRVLIDPQQSLEKALQALQEELEALARDFPQEIVEPPVLLGAEELQRDGILLRAQIRTHPAEHWTLKREFNRRVVDRFEKDGVLLSRAWPVPGRSE